MDTVKIDDFTICFDMADGPYVQDQDVHVRWIFLPHPPCGLAHSPQRHMRHGWQA